MVAGRPRLACKTILWHVLLSVYLTFLFFHPLAALAEPSVELEIRGIDAGPLENVRAALGLPPGIVGDERVNRPWLEHFIRQIPDKVRMALEPFGYFDPQIHADLEAQGDERYLVTVKVEAGDAVTVKKLSIRLSGQGSDSGPLLEAVRQFPLKKGDPLRQDVYERGKKSIRSKAVELGYLQAEFKVHRLRVFPERRSAEIELELGTGSLFYFGEATIFGAEEYPKPFLRRYLAYEPGEVFSYARLRQIRLNYLGADRFEEVFLVPEIDRVEQDRIPMRVSLVAGATRRLRSGAGYGTDTGFRLSASYQDLNVQQRAHKLAGDLLLAEKAQAVDVSYTVPGERNPHDARIFSLGFKREDLKVYENRVSYLEVEQVFGFGEGQIGSLYLRFFRESYEIGDQDDTAYLLMPGARFHQRSYDNPVNPKKGYQYRLELRGSHQTLGSDVGLLQMLAGGNAMLPAPGDLTLHLRAEAGLTLKDEALRKVPPSLRFFVGGDNSVRGYDYKSRGPRDETGDVVGGDGLLVAAVELERALGPQWGLAAFYDLGSAFNAFSEVRFIQGAGIGLRRYTPVGPVKLDLAYQVGEEGPGFRLHLSVGFDI